jgi:hypothetical protein
MNNNYYKSPKSTWLMRLFWKACGADRYLLERSTYSDQVKYFCLGGIVVATGVLAGIAGGYAIYTIFEPKGMAFDNYIIETLHVSGEEVSRYREMIHYPTLLKAIAFGIVWGLVIFNIDRFIVTSTGKGDGTEKITKQEFLGAIPRIIMGMIIAMTISKPIEIRMFKSEIDVALHEEQIKKELQLREEIDKKYIEKFDDLEKEFGGLEEQREKLQGQLIKATDEYSKRAADTYVVTRWTNPDNEGNRKKYTTIEPKPYVKSYETQMNNQKAQLDQFDEKNKNKLSELDSLKKELEFKKEMEHDQVNAVVSGLDGLLERIKLAHVVATWEISLFITLLFMVIELTPIFFKMMLIKGPYDYMDENVRELARAESGIEVEFEFYKDRETLQKMLENGGSGNIHEQKHGYEVHKITNHAAEVKRRERINMLKAQDELNEQIIEAWKQRKLEDIKQNPDKYISED